MKLVTVIGARPQFIKAAAVSRVLSRDSRFREIVVHTGQHYDSNMSELFFSELDIPKPHVNLQIGSAGHGAQTGRMLEGLESVLLEEKPDYVLVYGDTNSTLAGALAAAKLHIPVAHVEAGLRSFNRRMPEEINRIVTDHLSELLFAPTPIAVQNLVREGISSDRIHLTGDVMYDVALHYRPKSDEVSRILQVLGLESASYVLATIHRAENTDAPDRVNAIAEGLLAVGEQVPVVLPLHPRTRRMFAEHGILDKLADRIRLLGPVGYLDMIQLERNAAVIVTDSGGVQKEAFFYRVPCITLRDETEWTELVEAGWNRLVSPTDPATIASAALGAIGSEGDTMELYGGGRAAVQIRDVLGSM